MNDFKTRFNPLYAIWVLAVAIIYGVIFYSIFRLIRNSEPFGFSQYLQITLAFIALVVIFIMAMKPFIKLTKNYIIKDNSIEEFNFLTSKTKSIGKDEIKGFSTSIFPYRVWEFQVIIIYLKDGSKIDLMQFAYLNFKDIKSALLAKSYNYLGQEPYETKSFYSRIYKYDDRPINSDLGEKRNSVERGNNSEVTIKRPLTNDIKTKIKVIFVPYLIISLATLIGWSFFYWLLFIKFNVFQVDEELLSMIMPAVLPLIAILIWLNKRIKLLKIDKDHFPFYLVVACASIGCLNYFAHQYIILTTNKPTDLSSIREIEQKEPTKFYSIKNFYLDKKHFSIKKQFGLRSTKVGENLEMDLYITVPILNSVEDTLSSNCVGWYGVHYSETDSGFMDNHDVKRSWSPGHPYITDIGMDTIENSKEFKSFISDRMMVFDNLDVNQFLYFDRIAKTDHDYDNYVSAIKNNTKYDTKSDVVLLPCNEPIIERADYAFKAALVTFGAGSLLFLLMVINPDLKSEDEEIDLN